MVNEKTVAIVGITIVVMLGAFVVPTVIGSTNDQQVDRVTIDEGESYSPTQGLQMTLTDASPSEVMVDVIDNDTGTVENLTIAVPGNESYSLPGGDGNVTAVSATNQEATLEIDYSATYGFSDGARFFTENIGLFLIVMVFLVVAGGVSVVIS